MKKGKKYQLNILTLESLHQENMSMFKGLPAIVKNFMQDDNNHFEIVKRLNAGEIPTLTGIVGGTYCNMMFDDGFEFGVERKCVIEN